MMSLIGVISLIIFLVLIIPYWKERPEYISFPLLLLGLSFFIYFLNDLVGFMNANNLRIFHAYFWVFMFSIFMFLYKKKFEYLVPYVFLIFFPVLLSHFFFMDLLVSVEIIAYLISSLLFFGFAFNKPKEMKYASFIGISACLLLIFSSLSKTTYAFPLSLLGLAFSLIAVKI